MPRQMAQSRDERGEQVQEWRREWRGTAGVGGTGLGTVEGGG